MHFQSLLTFSIALLAGTSIAADYNGSEMPSVLREGRTKLRASNLLSGSSSASVAAATPTSSSSSSAMKVMTGFSSSAIASSAAAPSSSFISMARVSSSAAHRPAATSTHAARRPAPTASSTRGNTNIPIEELAGSQDDDETDLPFWNKPITDTSSRPRPNAPDFSATADTTVHDKEGCSLRCQELASQCVDLLPHDNDFCWQQYPSCQDRCIQEHVE